jgi:hypothetical protein
MDTTTALAVLTDALDRCRDEDMRTSDVFAALDFLAARATVKWPFEQFRAELLDSTSSELWEAEGRWQVLNASLNGIKLALANAQLESRGQKREWVFEPGAPHPRKKD